MRSELAPVLWSPRTWNILLLERGAGLCGWWTPDAPGRRGAPSQARTRRGAPRTRSVKKVVGIFSRESRWSSSHQIYGSRWIQVSMSGKGDCCDNAAMESFFSSLKGEWTDWHTYQTRKAGAAVDLW